MWWGLLSSAAGLPKTARLFRTRARVSSKALTLVTSDSMVTSPELGPEGVDVLFAPVVSSFDISLKVFFGFGVKES